MLITAVTLSVYNVTLLVRPFLTSISVREFLSNRQCHRQLGEESKEIRTNVISDDTQGAAQSAVAYLGAGGF